MSIPQMQIYNKNSHITIEIKNKHKMVVGVDCETVYMYFNASGYIFDLFLYRKSSVPFDAMVFSS